MTAARDYIDSKGNQSISDKPQGLGTHTNFTEAQGPSGYDLIPVSLHVK